LPRTGPLPSIWLLLLGALKSGYTVPWWCLGALRTGFGRALGVIMTCITCAPYYADMPKGPLVKAYLPCNIIWMAMFLQAAFMLESTGPGKNAMIPGLKLWYTQLPIQAVFVLLNFQAVSEAPTKSD
jgi:hypothetical protein